MNAGTIVSPDLLPAISAFQPTTLTVQVHNGTLKANGDPDPAGWGTLSGHAGLRGTIWPLVQSGENRDEFETARDVRKCILAGAYPQIEPKHRVLIGSDVFYILAVAPDSQGMATALEIEKVTT